MKKNISVNLFGTLYNIDEDAYQLLQQYEQSVHRYFDGKGEDDEVAQDVERRVAELFEELRQQNVEAITIEHVRDIIRRIGEPGEMDDAKDVQEEQNNNEGDASTAQKTQPQPKGEYRKLYRDPDDCMIGGVLSGLAHYIGGSATALRLLMVILAFFVASIPWLIICYLIACVLIPKAVTPEDKLRMMGRPVNLVSLGEGVINGVNEGVKTVQQRGCLGQVLNLIAVMFKIAIFVCAGIVAIIVGFILFVLLCVLLIALAASISSISLGESAFWLFNLNLPAECISQITNASFWMTIISMVLVCGIPLVCIIHTYRHLRGKEQSWSTLTIIAITLLWFLSIGLAISLGRITWKGLEEANLNYGTHFNVATTDNDDDQPIDDADADTIAVSDTIY